MLQEPGAQAASLHMNAGLEAGRQAPSSSEYPFRTPHLQRAKVKYVRGTDPSSETWQHRLAVELRGTHTQPRLGASSPLHKSHMISSQMTLHSIST